MWKMILSFAVLLVSSSAYALDCGDKDVIDGVIAIAKKNNVFLMDAVADVVHWAMLAQAEAAKAKDAEMRRSVPKPPLPTYRYSGPPAMWCADKSSAGRLSSGESWRLYHLPCFNHDPSQEEIQQAFDSTGTGEGHSLGNPKDALLTELAFGGPLGLFAVMPKEKQEEIKSKITQHMQYSVNTIRTKLHNPETDELWCAAQLKGDISSAYGGNYELAIKYTVETTTDRQLYIQITRDNLEDGQMH